jgi:hypothetical protein
LGLLAVLLETARSIFKDSILPEVSRFGREALEAAIVGLVTAAAEAAEGLAFLDLEEPEAQAVRELDLPEPVEASLRVLVAEAAQAVLLAYLPAELAVTAVAALYKFRSLRDQGIR